MSSSNDLQLANLTVELSKLKSQLKTMNENMAENNNAFFLVTMALIIFLMQCGFAFLEAGTVRSKNTTNILIKNLLDSCIAILSYWAIGWAFAWGHNSNTFLAQFVGTSDFFLYGMHDYPRFFFQFVFAATAATIVAGAVAERCQFAAYILYCMCISSIIYPILVHWGWSEQGWMFVGATFNGMHVKYQDFAGSGMVHLCGGTISFVAAYIMGPRKGRFSDNGQESNLELQGHSVPFAALGGFILMFCFLAFNGGSQADIVQPGSGKIVALAMINTIMSGASAAFTTLIYHYIGSQKLTLLLSINACLAGMVAACAGANQLEPVGAAVVGIFAAVLYMSLSSFLLKIKVDDPLEAFGVHAGGGSAGLIGAALFVNNGVVYGLYEWASEGDTQSIIFALLQLGWTLICALAIIIWSFATALIVFGVLKAFGILRVSEEVEVKGLDIYMHGEAAYPLHAYGHGWDEFESVKYEDNNLPRSRKISVNPEMSLEELAAAYEHRTTPGERKISLYRNPIHYEHPEFHSRSAHGNVFTKRHHVRPLPDPIPEAAFHEEDGHSSQNSWTHRQRPLLPNGELARRGEGTPPEATSISPNGSLTRPLVPDSPTQHITVIGCPAVPVSNHHSISIQPIDPPMGRHEY